MPLSQSRFEIHQPCQLPPPNPNHQPPTTCTKLPSTNETKLTFFCSLFQSLRCVGFIGHLGLLHFEAQEFQPKPVLCRCYPWWGVRSKFYIGNVTCCYHNLVSTKKNLRFRFLKSQVPGDSIKPWPFQPQTLGWSSQTHLHPPDRPRLRVQLRRIAKDLLTKRGKTHRCGCICWHTLPETNVAPENGASLKETSIPTIHFWVLC